MRAGSHSRARRAAHQVLLRVFRDRAYADRALDATLERVRLDTRDRAFVTELVYGTLRQCLAIDAHLEKMVQLPLHGLPKEILAALRMGAYQILHLRVADHAAVNETVEIVREKNPRKAGFVNALLRELARRRDNPNSPDITAGLDPMPAAALRTAHPPWLLAMVAEQIGLEGAIAFAEANNTPAPTILRVNTLKMSRDELADKLRAADVSFELPAVPSSAIVLNRAGDVRELPGFAEGLFSVQDLAAQLVGLMVDVPAGGAVLDLCAAPGGKATHLAERLDDKSVVIALDTHPGRTRLISENAKRLQLTSVYPGVANAEEKSAITQALKDAPNHAGKTIGAVMLDAPCSGLGTLRHHPELKLQPAEDVEKLVQLQANLLKVAASFVPVGGVLLYSVCSIHPREGVHQIAEFLRAHPGFVVKEPENIELKGLLRSSVSLPGPYLITWPHEHHSDGFFAVQLQRVADS